MQQENEHGAAQLSISRSELADSKSKLLQTQNNLAEKQAAIEDAAAKLDRHAKKTQQVKIKGEAYILEMIFGNHPSAPM